MNPPNGCSCCDCQGKKCLTSHPGHSHKPMVYELFKYSDEFLEDLLFDKDGNLKPQEGAGKVHES